MLLDATLDSAVALATSVERAIVPRVQRTPEATLRALPGVSATEQKNVLEKARDAFAHDVAPWLAVALMRDPAPQPHLAILTAEKQAYEAGGGYVLLSHGFPWAAAPDEPPGLLEPL